MGTTIAQYTPDFEPAVRAFNQRLARGGIRYRFPEEADTGPEDAPVIRRAFVAVQDGGVVRGGYRLKEQDFWLRGRRIRLGYVYLPLSEGLIDRTYSALAVQLLTHALKRQPLLFGLGIGGRNETFARMIQALGWTLTDVPFLFRIERPFRVARGLSYARSTPTRRLVLDAAAWSGAAWAAGHLLQRHRPAVDPSQYRLERIDRFGSWATELWERCRTEYRLAGWRDEATLQVLYPAESSRYVRLRLTYGGRTVAWAVALNTQMTGHRYFGDLRVGSIVDCLSEPTHALALTAAVSRHLAGDRSDLVVSNQAAAGWKCALRACGFSEGPSNFLFAASPRLARELGPWTEAEPTLHLTRGDGDGPINL